MRPTPNLAIVGATGAVGREFLTILEQRGFPHGDLRLLASPRSVGQSLIYRGERRPVEALSSASFQGVDIALFSAGASISREFAPIAVKSGAVVVDNSSAFRMDPTCPLVVPEVNPDAIATLRGSPGIIANPNCSAIILLVPLTPIRNAFGIQRIVVSTYQAASGAGAAAMQELLDQTAAVLAGKPAEPRIFPEPCAFNVFSHNSKVDPESGLNVEEQKMIEETRKIWGDPHLRMSPTCIRVPVMRAHSESINITLRTPASEPEIRDVLALAPGIRFVDDRIANRFPTPLKAAGADEILVGRLRPDESQPFADTPAGRRYHGYNLFVSGDQLRKGAALNAIQIAEHLLGDRTRHSDPTGRAPRLPLGTPSSRPIEDSKSHIT